MQWSTAVRLIKRAGCPDMVHSGAGVLVAQPQYAHAAGIGFVRRGSSWASSSLPPAPNQSWQNLCASNTCPRLSMKYTARASLAASTESALPLPCFFFSRSCSC